MGPTTRRCALGLVLVCGCAGSDADSPAPTKAEVKAPPAPVETAAEPSPAPTDETVPTKDVPPARQVPEDEECLIAKGDKGPRGSQVGRPIKEVASLDTFTCAVETGSDLDHLADYCPNSFLEAEIADRLLVCSGPRSTPRLFATLPESERGEPGVELAGGALGVLAGLTIAAINVLPPTDEPPDEAPAAFTGDKTVLARDSKDPTKVLRAGTKTERKALEAALPGFKAKPRRHYGMFLFRGKTKVALIMKPVGEPLTSIELHAPGLQDANGIEVGASIEDLRGIAGIKCEIAGDESYASYVACDAGEHPGVRYVFAFDHDLEFVEGISLDEAAKTAGSHPLSAIETWR